jgi:hypothetical protein
VAENGIAALSSKLESSLLEGTPRRIAAIALSARSSPREVNNEEEENRGRQTMTQLAGSQMADPLNGPTFQCESANLG